MKNWILGVLSIITISLLFTSCDHDTETFDGPLLIDRFGEFVLVEGLQVSQDVVDFSAGESVFFTAKFNKRVDFVLTITGMESGAVKVIEDFANTLDAENATWRGGVTNLPLFKAEDCIVELLIPEADSLIMMDEVTVTGNKSYGGSLFTDFETDLGNDIFIGNFEFEFSPNAGRQSDGLAAEGDWYYLFEGTDAVVPNFFVGLVDFKAALTGETYIPVPTSVPENLFFNAFVYADGGPYGTAVFQLATDSNDSGEFEDGPDAVFPFEYPLNWVGWRHVFLSLDELGISQEDIEKLVAVRVLLISDNNAQPTPPLQVDFGLDFMTFTADKPLEL